jgi:hypothetical protein
MRFVPVKALAHQYLHGYLPGRHCCGSIEMDTLIRVRRLSAEVSEDDRQTPYLY